MKRSFNKCVIFLAIVLMCQCVSASHIVKRDDNPGFFDTMDGLVGNVPLLGSSLSQLVKMMENLYNKVENLTNGALGRILGGALPCTIDLETRLTCTGVTAQSSLSDLVKSLLDPIPGLILPGFIKSMIYLSIDAFLMPFLDTVLGGMRMK